MNEKLFDSYDLNDILNPNDYSTVLMNMYWIVKDGKVFRYKQTKVWQCNKFEKVIEEVLPSYPGCEIMFLEYAYVPKD